MSKLLTIHSTAIAWTSAGGPASPIDDFYGQIKDEVSNRLSSMPAGQAVPLKQICSEEFWLQLSDGDRRLAGRYVAIMVSNGELPLAETPHRHEYPKKYIQL